MSSYRCVAYGDSTRSLVSLGNVDPTNEAVLHVRNDSILCDERMAHMSESNADDLPPQLIRDGFRGWSELDPEPGSPSAVEISHEEVIAAMRAKFPAFWGQAS
jgi:hypothetical protein